MGVHVEPGLQQHTGRVGNEVKFCMDMWCVRDQAHLRHLGDVVG